MLRPLCWNPGVERRSPDRLMLTALWNLSAAIRGYLRFYMPTNRAIDWLRTPRGLKWAIPAALVVTPAYLGLTAVAIHFAVRPGLGFLNVLVFLFFWNAMKFAWMAIFSVPLQLARALGTWIVYCRKAANTAAGRRRLRNEHRVVESAS